MVKLDSFLGFLGGLNLKQKESIKMFFNGSIYITDPCYISKDEDWCEESGFDVSSFSKNPTINSSLGFTSYLMEQTGCGDGSWRVYSVPGDKKLGFDDIFDIIEDTDNDLRDFEVIGEFGADAGLSCVVYKKEADAYNPGFENELPHSCYTLIKDFEGEIVVYFDEDCTIHFVGIGNKSFFTA